VSLDGQRLNASRYQVVPRTLIFGFRGAQVLLQRVPAGRGAWAGLWNAVGGHIEQGESVADAARREFLEETGLELTDLRLAGEVIVDLGASPGIALSVMVGKVGAGTPRSGAEGELRWFSPGDALAAAIVEDLSILLPRATACLTGAPPFTAIHRYEAEGTRSTVLE
jgi:8-oxo-dGTP diphosphatase